MIRAAAFAFLTLAVSACAANDARFLLEPTAATAPKSVSIKTIEVRGVSLPDYAAAAEIAQVGPDGALRNIPGSLWADDPVRAVTMALARSLDETTTAQAAAEPWPLEEPAEARVDVRVDRMLALGDGTFAFSGQFAIASPDGAVRERLEWFDIRQPLGGSEPGAVAAASGAAISALADRITAALSH